ncbi:MAG: molybdopterin-binding protein [Desulfobacteraceae bacterium]|jgi:hypothetical protein|nr:MAG: molybdopterin-binding protein [Desulfobacteraceae bacterium]
MASKYRSSSYSVTIEDSVGKVLAHDITEIRPAQFKGPAFKKGYIVKKEDLPHLRRLGKEHLYVLNLGPGEVHEDDAALKLSEAIAGPGVTRALPPSEGKISLKAAFRGLLKVDVGTLTELNMVPDICCASLHNNTIVEEGEIISATRAIPLIIDQEILDKAVSIARSRGGIFSVVPLSSPPAGIVITGNEVFNGLIEDKFAPILRKKLETFGCPVLDISFAPDDRELISAAVKRQMAMGAGLLMVAGGMSVDPDDVSRLAIADSGAKEVVYGTPVLPGAMFLVGRIGNVPVVGIPACVLYFKATVLDLVLPRILAGDKITRKDLAELAHGGLCMVCKECRYPVCPFGK